MTESYTSDSYRTQDVRYKYPISNCLTVTGSLFYLPFLPLHLLLVHLSKIEEGEVKSKCPVKEYDSPDVCPGRGRWGGLYKGGRDQLLRKLFFFVQLGEETASVLTTPIRPVQCWSLS